MKYHKKTDKKDFALLNLLQQNSRKPLSELARSIHTIRETAYYRIQQLQQRGIILQYTTYISVSSIGLSIYSVFLTLNTNDPAKRKEILDYIKNNGAVTWAALVGGSYDLIVAIQAQNAEQFKEIYAALSEPFKELIHDEVHIQRLRLHSYGMTRELVRNRRDLMVSQPKRETIDALDKNILSLLATNSRLDTVSIGRTLNTPAATVHERIKQLEKKQIISGYGILLDYTKLGKQTYQVLLTTTALVRDESEALESFCRANEKVHFYVETMGLWSYEITLVVDNQQELQDALNEIKAIVAGKLRGLQILLTFDYYLKYASVGSVFMQP